MNLDLGYNGCPVADLVDLELFERYSDGFVALQVHAHLKGGVEIEWPNLRTRSVLQGSQSATTGG